MNNELITIVERVTPIDNTTYTSVQYYNDRIERPYSLTPGEFFYDIKYITYPGVVPNMYLINTRGTYSIL